MKQSYSLIKQLTPEEIELEKKRAELSLLEDELVLKELDLTTLQVGLEDLRRRYLHIVGVKLAKLDGIEAQIAEIIARLEPENEEVQKKAERSRSQAQESANATASITEEEYETKPFRPSEDIKKLYHDLAKKVHPDLAPDEKSRKRRHRFMQDVNEAYAAGDVERLRSLLNEWESSPASVSGEWTGAELIRIIRQLARVRNRIEVISKEIEKLKDSELYKLKLKIDETQEDGKDILSQMAAEVDGQIEDANTRLKNIHQRMETTERNRTKQKNSKG
ncbi:MAG: DnaJ domain-containing protein [Anaerolineaceae bacterium]|nr:DnaJ domain-containing protein [Anaerolineaceae bacterium]